MPLSLLPICGKIFKRPIFNSLFEYLEKYKLLSANQSDFCAKGSCVNQLLSMVHNIYTAFDAYPTLEPHGNFWICLRFLMKYDMRSSFLNLNQWVFLMLY